jgi:tetratricopeptide (TPR) repeat protein
MGARGSLHARQWQGSPSGGEAIKRRGFILTVIFTSGVWRGLRTRFAGVSVPMLWLALAAAPAAAQVSQQATYADPRFQTIFGNPGDLASEVKYAAGAKDGTDIENAIGAYDRLLFYNPALSRVRFELGVLYARLGSYQQARTYFESALQMRDITPEMAEQAQH